jgi:hypothetical protein
MTKEEIVELLQAGVCKVTFTKVNGEVRQMPCTLKSELLPPVDSNKLNEEKTRKQNPDNLSVWCTDKNEWRSFKIANVQKITPIVKTHTITLDEDPETGDLLLPFTDEILQEAGWKEGDTIEWIDNKDGSWSLVKQQDETAK